MRTDRTATALVFLLVLIVGIFTLSSLAQVEPDSPDIWPVYGGATYTPTLTSQPAVLTLVAGATFHPSVPTSEPTPSILASAEWPPLYVQAMTPTLRPVIIPKWGR